MYRVRQLFFILFGKYKFNKVISISATSAHPSPKARLCRVFFILIILTLSACTAVDGDLPSLGGDSLANISSSVPEPVIIDLKKAAMDVKANEAGKIMVLMYHIIGSEKEASWIQTADNFRRDLENLYKLGYSLISLKDLVHNNINTPGGRTPVVLTFDDGTEGHFRYLVSKEGNKEIDPDSAVGILLDFSKQHPEFGHTATFYINDQPFRQNEFRQEKLRHLIDLGFDIGNHTLTHPKLNKVSDEIVQKELAGLAKMVEEAVPGYKVQSLALPHGLSPKDNNLSVQGTYGGYSYCNQAVLRVGANPSMSPAVKGFDPLRLPRVQGSTVELTKWIEYFQKRPKERYISDGDPDTVAIPRDREDQIDKEKISEKTLIIY